MQKTRKDTQLFFIFTFLGALIAAGTFLGVFYLTSKADTPHPQQNLKIPVPDVPDIPKVTPLTQNIPFEPPETGTQAAETELPEEILTEVPISTEEGILQ